jgi:dGTPase
VGCEAGRSKDSSSPHRPTLCGVNEQKKPANCGGGRNHKEEKTYDRLPATGVEEVRTQTRQEETITCLDCILFCFGVQDLSAILFFSMLEPYAVPLTGTLGRTFSEEEDVTRSAFQRDRDRILHTQAFRRLAGKTQVFTSGSGDHYRTRMSHTLEVAQISRDSARFLGLNEDLAECIALAHDLGHTPFGHAGEEALSECMKPYDISFEHNDESVAIVTQLEEYSSHFHGLNLNCEVIEGLMKHHTVYDHPSEQHEKRSPSLEAQVVNIADEVAYTAHDIDDGLRSGLLKKEDILALKLGSRAIERSEKRGTDIRGNLIHLLLTDLYEETQKCITERKIISLDAVYQESEMIVHFSEEMKYSLQELRSLLWHQFYMRDVIQEEMRKGQNIIQELFETYLNNPPEKVRLLQEKFSFSLPEAVMHYIAGMTDEFARKNTTAHG